MLERRKRRYRACVLCLMLAAASGAQAEPGNAAALAKARREYAEAMQGHNAGLQNAMRVQLAHQLAEAKKRTHRRPPADAGQDDPRPQFKEHNTQSALPGETDAER